MCQEVRIYVWENRKKLENQTSGYIFIKIKSKIQNLLQVKLGKRYEKADISKDYVVIKINGESKKITLDFFDPLI